MKKSQPRMRLAEVALSHPIVPPPADLTVGNPPDLGIELEPPAPLGRTRNAPPRPRVAQPQTPPQQVPEEPSREPVIAPELSPQESAAARSAAQASLDAAERNLALTSGHALTIAQQDLTSKIRGFMDNARDALRNSDWQRAKTLAKKAEVLSAELAGSL